MTKVIVGAANFFQEYGVTQENSSTEKIQTILKNCIKFDIKNIDTAINYEIEPEKISISNKLLSRFNIGTKISIRNKEKNKIDFIDNVLFNLAKSLIYWGKDKFEYIYCHDILNKKEELELFIQLSEKLKNEGLTKSIGLSVYDFSDINHEILYIIDRLQIPDNLYLQRNPHEILFLKNLDITIDVRSIFLQGVIPNEIMSYKKKIPYELLQHHLKALQRSKNIGISMYDLAIQYIKKQSYSNIVIGVDNSKQISQFFKSFNKDTVKINFDYFKINSKFIDPRLW